MRLILALIVLAGLPALAAQAAYGVYGTPQVPANNVAQGRADYTALAFAAASVSGTIIWTDCTVANVNSTSPAVAADILAIRIIRDAYPYNLSYDVADSIVATVNSPTFPVNFSGFNEVLPSAGSPTPWPYFIAIDVAPVGTSTVGHVFQLALTSFTANGTLITGLPTGNDQTISTPTTAEMGVTRNSTPIQAGGQDNVGNRAIGTPFTLDYTIGNTGNDPLVLGGSPMVEIVSASLLNCTASVALSPTSPVNYSTTTTFQLSVTPTTAGQPFGFGFIIPNNDNDENPYNIVVLGDAVAAPGPATQLVLVTQPAGAAPGVAFTTQPVVQVQDSTGALVSSDNSTQVTVSITAATGTSGAVLSGTTTVTAVNGVVTFSGLSIDLAGSGYTLDFTDGGALTDATSNTFDVSAGGGGPGGGGGGGGSDGGGCSAVDSSWPALAALLAVMAACVRRCRTLRQA
ncbi:MAG: hypothetical protein H6839_01110 [Planctomycetes bacterium]|nr:hypothetical protein [Planctomycetota bacterium]